MLQTAGIFFGLSQIALTVIMLVRTKKCRLAETLFTLLLLCVASDMLLQLGHSRLPLTINILLSFMQTATAGMFWLFCYALFDDHFHLKRWQLSLVFTLSLLPFFVAIYSVFGSAKPSQLAISLLIDIPQLVELVLIFHGLSIIARFRKNDLVPLRRRFGNSLILFTGLFISLVISTRYVFSVSSPWMIDTQYILLGLFLLYLNVQLFQWQPVQLFGASATEERAAQPVPPVSVADTPKESDQSDQLNAENAKMLIRQLKQLMEKDKIYQKTGLTINDLAKEMQMPEYRLRLLINGQLGYRNFSDFVGRYRIEEAARRLADPTEKRLPVLSIALGVGYRSLSSFNKSFKETHQLTPTEYRRQRLLEMPRSSS